MPTCVFAFVAYLLDGQLNLDHLSMLTQHLSQIKQELAKQRGR